MGGNGGGAECQWESTEKIGKSVVAQKLNSAKVAGNIDSELFQECKFRRKMAHTLSIIVNQ